MTTLRKEWVVSFARQALSDLNAREILSANNASKCHRLHFLQMAAEKLCKAYLIKSQTGHDGNFTTHAVIKRHLKTIARYYGCRSVGVFANEIEVLSPACRDGGVRQDNTEYPWLSATGKVIAPCEWSFPNLDDRHRSIVELIKLIKTASEDCIRF